MSATIYQLPTQDDFALVEDLLATVESRLDDLHSGLKAPFDGDPETQAEPVTLGHAGRVFLFSRLLRQHAGWFGDRAGRIEDALVNLRDIQEEDDDLRQALGAESYLEYASRRARQYRETAEQAAETLPSAERREGENAR